MVDEEKIVRDVAGAILREGGYTVLSAGSGNAAEISLAVLDANLSGLSAERTLAALLALRPDLAVVVSSGSLPDDALHPFDLGRVSDFVQKPYTSSRLRKAVDSALRSHPLAA